MKDMKSQAFWIELLDSLMTGLQWGFVAVAVVCLLLALSEIGHYTQATYSLVRDMRPDLRSRLPHEAEKESE
jgi:hypothetical protein